MPPGAGGRPREGALASDMTDATHDCARGEGSLDSSQPDQGAEILLFPSGRACQPRTRGDKRRDQTRALRASASRALSINGLSFHRFLFLLHLAKSDVG